MLTMIAMIIDLKDKTQYALKCVSHFQLCLTEAELSILSELKTLQTPFKNFTDIFSGILPTLSSPHNEEEEICKLCMVHDDTNMNTHSVKQCILRNLDRRFPESAQSRIQ